MAWIRIRMDPELLHGSGARKIQSWIRNKSFLIHNTAVNPRSIIFLVEIFRNFTPPYSSAQKDEIGKLIVPALQIFSSS